MKIVVQRAYDAKVSVDNDIVGSIAGDDTIMVAVRTLEDTYAVMDKIRAFCG